MQPISATPQKLTISSPIGRGTMMRSLRRRAVFVWLGFAIIGLMPSLLGWSSHWQAAGLGLWVPGGGFLYVASPFYFVITLLLFVVSLLLWGLMGGFIFPLLVWGGAAILAALAAGDSLWTASQYGVPLLAVTIIGIHILREKRFEQSAVPKAADLHAYLESIAYREPEKTPIVGDPLSDDDLGAMRYTLDLVLQPIDEFKGFVTIDQFREAAWRYQLVTISYALAMLQTCRTPAFRGYLHEAQRRAIIKMKDRRVWKYWRIENFVGNLGLNPDPIIRDNIMYSGWWGLAIGAFERATGDMQFSQPGALTLKENNGKEYVYDFTSMMEVVAKNFDSDELCFFPCEPNWVFSICNLFGITGLLTHDRTHNSTLGADRLDKFNHVMENEFTMAEGRAAIVNSKRSGFVLAVDVAGAFTATSQLLNMASPRLAQAYWAIGLRALKLKFGDDRSKWGLEDGVDAGNYQKNGATFWVSLMRGAKEMGDTDMFEYAEQRYRELGVKEKSGALHWQGSVLSQTTGHMARFATKDAWYRLAHGEVPAAISSGPILDAVPYPEVLVAGAANDGQTLKLVLCSGNEPSVQPLTLDRLNANSRYTVQSSEADDSGKQFVTDANGQYTLSLLIGQRTTMSISPV